jgi:hypothetical protein
VSWSPKASRAAASARASSSSLRPAPTASRSLRCRSSSSSLRRSSSASRRSRSSSRRRAVSFSLWYRARPCLIERSPRFERPVERGQHSGVRPVALVPEFYKRARIQMPPAVGAKQARHCIFHSPGLSHRLNTKDLNLSSPRRRPNSLNAKNGMNVLKTTKDRASRSPNRKL